MIYKHPLTNDTSLVIIVPSKEGCSSAVFMRVFNYDFMNLIIEWKIEKLKLDLKLQERVERVPEINDQVYSYISLIYQYKCIMNFFEDDLKEVLNSYGFELESNSITKCEIEKLSLRLRYLNSVAMYNYMITGYSKYNPMLVYHKEIRWLKCKLDLMVLYYSNCNPENNPMNLKNLIEFIELSQPIFSSHLGDLKRYIKNESKDDYFAHYYQDEVKSFSEIYLIITSIFKNKPMVDYDELLNKAFYMKGNYFFDPATNKVSIDLSKDTSWIQLINPTKVKKHKTLSI